MRLLIRWFLFTAALLLVSFFIPGIDLHSNLSALLATAALAIINAVLRPILLVLTLPINILSLGLFTFVINALMLQLCAIMIPGFYIASFVSALIASVVLSILCLIINTIQHR